MPHYGTYPGGYQIIDLGGVEIETGAPLTVTMETAPEIIKKLRYAKSSKKPVILCNFSASELGIINGPIILENHVSDDYFVYTAINNDPAIAGCLNVNVSDVLGGDDDEAILTIRLVG